MTTTTTSARFDTRDIARIAVFAAIIAALGLIGPIQVGPVPITAQTLGVILAGAVLGPRRGAAAVGVFLLLVFIGFPLLSGGHGGAAVFVGVTAGYLVGWIPGAFVVGLIAYSGRGSVVWWRVALGGVIGGILVIYFFGIPVYSAVSKLPLGDTIVANLIFVPGDLIKIVIVTLLTVALWRAYPPVFGARASRRGQSTDAVEAPAASTEPASR